MTASRSEAAAAAERLAALGRLAGGVAHDFNNILTVVNGYAEIIAQTVGDDDDAREAVEMILDAARRGGLVTRQLHQFSRPQDAEAWELDIAAAVQDCAPALRRLPAANVEVRIDIADTPALARIDREVLTQALTLLVTHAGGALPTGGTVLVSVRPVARAGFVDAAGDAAPAGAYVQVSVSDTGEGLDDHARLRIFEPFYSPTGQGKGAGLMLAAVFGIAKGNGGFIEVASMPGRGTAFTLSLPLVRDLTAGSGSAAGDVRIAVETIG